MDPAPVANIAGADSPEPSRREEHGKKHGSESSTAQDSAQPLRKESDPAPSMSGQPEAETQGRTDAGLPAAKGSDESSRERTASSASSEEKPEAAAAGEASDLPAAEHRNPKSIIVPALVVAAVVLLILSVVLSSLIWGGPARNTTSTSGGTDGTTASISKATDATTASTRTTASIWTSTSTRTTASSWTTTSLQTTTSTAAPTSGVTDATSASTSGATSASAASTSGETEASTASTSGATDASTTSTSRATDASTTSTSRATEASTTSTSRATDTSTTSTSKATDASTTSTSRATDASTTSTSRATDKPTSLTTLCPDIPTLSPDAALAATTVGRLVGSTVTVGGVRLSRWLGVPYAESTAGERRFANPVPLSVADQCVVVDAQKPRPPCAQWVQGSVVGSEDCLRLNIWAPAEPPSGNAKRSLVVAATGYWFQRGTNDVPQWEELAAQAGVVLVSPNVRLGVLGFLHSTTEGFASDVGKEDATFALRWALDNAAAFGADPSVLMLVGNGTGGYLLADAAEELQVKVARAVLEGSLYTSVLPRNTGSFDPTKQLVTNLGCNVGNSSTWLACLSNASLEVLLNTTAAMELRFAAAWSLNMLLPFGKKKKIPSITDIIAGADIDQARNLIDEYIRPAAEASGNASTLDALLTYTLTYLVGDVPKIINTVKKLLKGGSLEDNLVYLAMAISGCGTRTVANKASSGHHYVVDGGSHPLFEPMLSTADVAEFLANGKVPSLKNGDEWPASSARTRFLFANGTEIVRGVGLCKQMGG